MRTPINAIIIYLTAVLLGGCQAGNNNTSGPSSGRYRLIHNNDGSDLLANRWFGERPLTMDDLMASVDLIANTPITTYMMCSGSDFFYYRSPHGRLFGDDCNGTLTAGNDTASYRILRNCHKNFLKLESEGIDFLGATLTRAKEKGKEAFITYRMNDLHCNDTAMKSPINCTEFWKNHPQYWLRDTTQGWNSAGALNFVHKEVRDHKLAIVSEQIDRYEMIDGMDLDFMRFIVYFHSDSGRIHAPLMTQLVKDIRSKIDHVSAQRNKKLLLSVRVPITVEACEEKGLDIKEWIRLGLIDFISIGVHWTGDPSIPVAKFKADLKTNLPVYATIDDGGFRPRESYSHGMFRGIASHILSQGADGIYLFNYFLSEYIASNRHSSPESGGLVCRIRTPELLVELGSLPALEGRNKSYSPGDGRSQYKVRPISPLPLTVTPGKEAVASVWVGDTKLEELQETILFFRTDKPLNLAVSVNGCKLSPYVPHYVAMYDRNRGIEGTDREYALIVPSGTLRHGSNLVTFGSPDPGTVKRIDLVLKYGDVSTHGYF